MGSLRAQTLARKIVENSSQGKSKTMKDLMLESGYPRNTAIKPSQVMRSKSFTNALAVESVPLIDGLQSQITKIKKALDRKDLDSEESKVLTYMLDTMIKNYQLLSGGATERQVFVLPSEVMGRNKIEATEDKPLLNDGSTQPPISDV